MFVAIRPATRLKRTERNDGERIFQYHLRRYSTQRPTQRYVNLYHYVPLSALETLRDNLLMEWGERLNVKGRVYIYSEGINAQLSLPDQNYNDFVKKVKSYPIFKHINVFEGDKMSSEGTEGPFQKLHVRIRPLVLDRKVVDILNMKETGRALTPEEWDYYIAKKMKNEEKVTIVDCRNIYESEIGRFVGAERLNIDKHLYSFEELDKILQGKQEEKVMLYCTGGIRCEKIGAYLIQQKGFKDINRLHGGINNYLQYVKNSNQPVVSQFKGKNFVFDNRILSNHETTRATSDVLSECHFCKKPEDRYFNCLNPTCNILYVSCDSCWSHHNKCCSSDCEDFFKLSEHQQLEKIKKSTGRNKDFNAPRSYVSNMKSINVDDLSKFWNDAQTPPESDKKKQAVESPTTVPVTEVPVVEARSDKGVGNLNANVCFEDSPIQQYALDHTTSLDDETNEIYSNTVKAFPQRWHNMVGPLQAQLLRLLISMTNSKRILEIGTFTGYSALAMASALPKNQSTSLSDLPLRHRESIVVSCEVDEEMAKIAYNNISNHPHGKNVILKVGDAAQTLKVLLAEGNFFDFVFLDADKRKYAEYYDLLIGTELLKDGGVLLVDNVLWKGKVLENSEQEKSEKKKDKRIQAIRNFNFKVKNDNRVEVVLLPIRDGLTIIRKISQQTK